MWAKRWAHGPCLCSISPIAHHGNRGDHPLMMMDPRTVERLLGYMSKAVWLIMAYSFGTMVGRLIVLAQNT
ncbi:MAG: hypothetical protein ACR2NO_11265 [Chloroflexota bacterium]